MKSIKRVDIFILGGPLLLCLMIFSSPSYAVELLCKGNVFIYEPGMPKQGGGSVVIEIDDTKNLLSLRGLPRGGGSAKFSAVPERIDSFLPIEHVIDGDRYPWVYVALDRYSGQVLIVALRERKMANPLKGLFDGTCTQQSRLF